MGWASRTPAHLKSLGEVWRYGYEPVLGQGKAVAGTLRPHAINAHTMPSQTRP